LNVKQHTDGVQAPFWADLVNAKLQGRRIEAAGGGDGDILGEVMREIVLGGQGFSFGPFIVPMVGTPEVERYPEKSLELGWARIMADVT
jgi:hypothetical protein